MQQESVAARRSQERSILDKSLAHGNPWIVIGFVFSLTDSTDSEIEAAADVLINNKGFSPLNLHTPEEFVAIQEPEHEPHDQHITEARNDRTQAEGFEVSCQAVE